MSLHRVQVEDETLPAFTGQSVPLKNLWKFCNTFVKWSSKFPLVHQPQVLEIPPWTGFSINTLITYRLKQSRVSSAVCHPSEVEERSVTPGHPVRVDVSANEDRETGSDNRGCETLLCISTPWRPVRKPLEVRFNPNEVCHRVESSAAMCC